MCIPVQLVNEEEFPLEVNDTHAGAHTTANPHDGAEQQGHLGSTPGDRRLESGLDFTKRHDVAVIGRGSLSGCFAPGEHLVAWAFPDEQGNHHDGSQHNNLNLKRSVEAGITEHTAEAKHGKHGTEALRHKHQSVRKRQFFIAQHVNR